MYGIIVLWGGIGFKENLFLKKRGNYSIIGIRFMISCVSEKRERQQVKLI